MSPDRKNEKATVPKPEIDASNIENLFKDTREKDRLINVPKTLLKKEEWGLLTILNLLLAGIFPAYFVNIMLLSLFTEVGHLFTTHLTELERQKLLAFEIEFRAGYEKEKELKWKEAIAVYAGLREKYAKSPNIAIIAEKRIEWIRKNQQNEGK